MSITVSVIIPAYNAERFIRQTLDSVKNQTFRDFEVLVVDDGSTDETAKIVESYSDPVFCLRKTNGGVSSARNYGIEKARGKYIAFLDADDVWMPEKLEKQVALLESNPDVGLCYTAAIVVDENSNEKGRIEAKKYDDATEGLLLNMNILILSSSFVRKDIVLQTGGFDSEFSTCADKDYWLRLSLLTKFAPVNEFLVKYRDVSGSMSSDPELSRRDTLGVLRKFFSLQNLPSKYKNLENKAYSNSLMVISGEFLHSGNLRESLRCMWQSVKRHPQNISRPLGLPFRLLKRFLPN